VLIVAPPAFAFIHHPVSIRNGFGKRVDACRRGGKKALTCALGKNAAAYSNDVPYREAEYDPVAAEGFFRARPLAALSRLAQLVVRSTGFVLSVILDKRLGREDSMVEQRSQELLALVTSLGPTFIKVGQALSTRSDLLPAAYAAGLTGLQDAVPPFSGGPYEREYY